MLIIPDVHGREFWKEAVKGHEEEKIIFLGDYLDPYPWEFPEYYTPNMRALHERVIKNFEEILEFKKAHPNVILLLGNHDCEYAMSKDICDCRCDDDNYDKIRQLFLDNKDLFLMCYQENGVTYSHSGISSYWTSKYYPEATRETLIDMINNDYLTGNERLPMSLAACGYLRGGSEPAGSIVWRDARESICFSHGYQVFGHTQLEKAYVTNWWACLDAREAFIIEDDNTIKTLGGEVLPSKLLESSEEDSDA